MSEKHLLTLTEIEADQLALVGAKSLNLALLTQNSLTSLAGLVVTTDFFRTQIDHYAYGPVWAGSPDVAVTEGALQFLADFLKTTPLAPGLSAELTRRLEQVFPPRVQFFAVRSSAVDEDHTDRSFAGCHLTELTVPRALLPVSLTRCWASALTGPAIEYRLRHSMSLQAIKIAVLIQPMLKPDVAGVAFSMNPVTGNRDELVIEAAPNLGDAVVSGRVTPAGYHLLRQHPHYPVLEKLTGEVGDPAQELLSTRQLTTLAQTVEQVEALMTTPQDVEWAYQAGKLYLLQTRPVTAAAQANPLLEPAHAMTETDFSLEWTRANHPETLPELPSPLLVSLMTRSQSRGVRFFERMGLDVFGLGAYIKSFQGRPYLNLSMIKRVLRQLGFNPAALLAMVGYIPAETLSNPFSINWSMMWQARKSYRRLLAAVLTAGKTVRDYQHTVSQTATRLRKSAATPTEALAQFKLREQIYGDLIGAGLILLSALTGLTVLIARLLKPVTASDTDVFSVLGTLGKDPAIIRHNATLRRLAHRARTEKSVLDYLFAGDGDFADYQTALARTRFLANFEDYLAEFGHYALYVPDIGRSRYVEDPAALLKTVAQYANFDSPPENDAPHSVWRAWRNLTADARGLGRWLPWRQAFAWPLMLVLNRLFGWRNAMRAAEAQAMAAVRKWDIRLAQKWQKAHLLEAADDYFWLTMEEIERALVTEKGRGVHLKPAIVARKTAYQTYRRVDAPHVLAESDLPGMLLGETRAAEALGGTLVGLPVSPGIAEGTVQFLRDFDRFEQVPPACVLVVPSADPAYLSWFPLAAGLIVERGGMLSHGSIIAREYGLPAVSNVPDARQQLKSGDRVLLDGSTGVIQILDRAED